MSDLRCVRRGNGILKYYRIGGRLSRGDVREKAKPKKREVTFTFPLPVEIVVWILSQDLRLLTMTYRLSKEISKLALPLRMSRLIRKPFIPREFGVPQRFPPPIGMYSVDRARRSSPYAWVRLAKGKAWYVVVPRGNRTKYYAGDEYPWYAETMVERQPDLYTSKALYTKRGNENAQRLVRNILCERYERHHTLDDILRLHAFLLMHRVLMKGEAVRHSYVIEGDLDCHWNQEQTGIVNKLVEEIREMYPEIMVSL